MYKNKKQTSQMARLLYLFRCYSGLRIFRLCNRRLLRSLHCVSFPTAVSLSSGLSLSLPTQCQIRPSLRLTHFPPVQSKIASVITLRFIPNGGFVEFRTQFVIAYAMPNSSFTPAYALLIIQCSNTWKYFTFNKFKRSTATC